MPVSGFSGHPKLALVLGMGPVKCQDGRQKVETASGGEERKEKETTDQMTLRPLSDSWTEARWLATPTPTSPNTFTAAPHVPVESSHSQVALLPAAPPTSSPQSSSCPLPTGGWNGSSWADPERPSAPLSCRWVLKSRL